MLLKVEVTKQFTWTRPAWLGPVSQKTLIVDWDVKHPIQFFVRHSTVSNEKKKSLKCLIILGFLYMLLFILTLYVWTLFPNFTSYPTLHNFQFNVFSYKSQIMFTIFNIGFTWKPSRTDKPPVNKNRYSVGSRRLLAANKRLQRRKDNKSLCFSNKDRQIFS